jgi:hypothetical protein
MFIRMRIATNAVGGTDATEYLRDYLADQMAGRASWIAADAADTADRRAISQRA